jgi:anion-transporting  ArsA/GET3 family ATPase
LLAPSPAARDEILANPVYDHISTAVAGSQEYTAMAKLYELEHAADREVIVLDTPPSRHAIDFLQAPDRLLGFLEGRALVAFLRRTGHAIRAAGVVFGALRRITGSGLLDDGTSFFRLLSELLDGFRRRAADVHELLTDPATTFLIVTSPERAALDEAVFFAAELDHAHMHRSGVIVNRLLVAVHPEPFVVLPPELGWTAMRRQAEAALRQIRDELAPGARIVVETDWSVPRALERVVAREHRNLLDERGAACLEPCRQVRERGLRRPADEHGEAAVANGAGPAALELHLAGQQFAGAAAFEAVDIRRVAGQ